MLKKISEKLPDVLLAAMVSFSITYALTSSMSLTYPPFSILLIILGMTVFLFIAFFNRTTAIITAVLFGVAFASSLVYVALHIKLNELVEFFDDYFFWLYDFIMYPDVPDPTYQLITVNILCLLVSVLSFIFVVKKFRFLVILAGGMSVFAIQASYNLVFSITSFYIFLAAVLISYLRHVYQIKSSKEVNDYVKPSVLVLWSIPLSIVIILMASSIQASDKPIQWKWLDQKILTAYNRLKERFDYESFDYFSLSASSGFGDSNDFLGGRVRLDRTNVLYVTTNKRAYLRGAVRDVYTGTKWVNSIEELTPLEGDHDRLYSDTEEMLEGLKILTGTDELPEGLLYVNPISVRFLNLRTRSLFIPSKVSSFEPVSADITTFLSDTGDLSSKDRLSKNFQYKMTSYIPAIGSEDFEAALRKSRRGLYEEHLKDIVSLFVSDMRVSALVMPSTYKAVPDEYASCSHENHMEALPDSSPSIASATGNIPRDKNELVQRYEKVNKFKQYSDAVYEQYLQLPDELPRRIRDLAASLVVTAGNDYDKARAIEKYVSEKYAYNLDVRTTPRDRDFVDYFLFDQQEGYCSYFASAMTVLARCAGLPARYVEGYMLPPEPVDGKYDTYVVTNMQAHAWTEIYFEGYGWLPFEPTPPFRNAFYATDVQEHVYVSPGYNPAYDDYMEMMKRYYSGETSGINADPGTFTGRSRPMPGTVVLWVVLVTGSLFLLLLAFNAVRSKVRLFRFASMPPGSSVIRHYNYYIGLLNLAGFGIKPSETPYQYAARIDKLLFFSPVRFKNITDIFVRTRYSRHDATEQEKQLFTEFNPGFLNEIKISMGKLKYFTQKYILGRI